MTDHPAEEREAEQRESAREATLASVLDEDAELMRRLAGTPPGPGGTSDSLELRIRKTATELDWLRTEGEFGMLTAAEVQDHHADPAELLSVQRYGETRYPGWQFGPDGVLPVVAELREAAERYDVSAPSVLLWMVGPTIWWVGEASHQVDRPVDHLNEPDEVVKAFRSAFGDWD